MADASPPKSVPPRKGITIALICIGLLILIPSGLCTAVFGASVLVGMNEPGEAVNYARAFAWLVPIFAGPPIALGTALLIWGLKRYRR